MVQALGVCQFLKRLNTELPCDPATPFLGPYAREMKACPAKTCSRVFTAPLFMNTKRWKRPKWLPADKYINKMWYSIVMQYYPATERNEVMIGTTPWTNLKNTHQAKRQT